jgi:hypothetical protein
VMEQMAAAYRGPHTVRLNRNPANLGIVRHSNHIWRLSAGSLLTTCGGDDIAEPNRVERLVETWRAGAGKVLLVHSSVMQIDEDGRELGLRLPAKITTENPSAKDIVVTGVNGIGATTLYDKRLIDFFGYLPEACRVEDGPMFFRAALLGEIAYVDEPLVRYRVGGMSSRHHMKLSPGAQFLRGHRIRMISWSVGSAKSALVDMEKGDFSGKEDCAEILHHRIKHNEFEVALWEATPLRRFAMIPEGVRRSVSMGASYPLRQALRQALGPLYIAYFNLRHGR